MPAPGSTYRKWLIRSLLVVAAAVVLWRFPLFHVVSLEEAEQKRAAEVFHPEEYVAKFWDERLPKELDKAIEATTLMAAVRKDPNAAKAQYGVTLKAKSEYYYFVRGRGRVVGVEEGFVALSLDSEGSKADVLVTTGPIFSNALRDGTGLIHPSDFHNQQDFNGISQELNRIVEDRVLPPFRDQVDPGDNVEFTGCAEIVVERTDLDPMTIVPIVLEVQ